MYNYGSDGINDQLVPVKTWDAFSPRGYGPMMVAAPSISPTLPPFLGNATGTPGAAGSAVMGGDQANVNAAAQAAAQPFNLRLSPVVWALGFLLVGLVGLRVVHWRKG